MKIYNVIVLSLFFSSIIYAQKDLEGLNLSNIYCVPNAKLRSINLENFTGERGKGGIAEISDSGTIQHIWMKLEVNQTL